MKETVDKLIHDPEYFLTLFKQEKEKYISEALAGKTVEWKARNPVGTISGSSFATCIRQAWYRAVTGGSSDNQYFSMPAKKRMWLGLVHEAEIGRILDRLPGKLHLDQAVNPVNVRHPEHAEFSSTTDFVKELAWQDKLYYIPIEVKTTELDKWQEFTYHEFHLRQLMLWMHYAKARGWNVPYGVLHYLLRSDWQDKTTIIACDTSFRKIGRSIMDYQVYQPFLNKRMQTLRKHIKAVSLPAMPNDVPMYICDSCYFRELCFANEKPDRESK